MLNIKKNLKFPSIFRNLQPTTYHLKPSKGFTLIELLVVIAIIGILSSVVLASLNSARGKGADASVKSNLSNIRAQAEMIYDNNASSYLSPTSVCTDTTVTNAIASAKSAAAISTTNNLTLTTAGSSGTITCHASATGWAIEVPLKSTATSFFCVDANGVGVVTTATSLGASDTTCN